MLYLATTSLLFPSISLKHIRRLGMLFKPIQKGTLKGVGECFIGSWYDVVFPKVYP